MSRLFISHSSQDDAFVRDLRIRLAEHGHDGWIDSRELRGGDPLWSEIQQAIEAASAYAIVVSPGALQSKWVGKELRHALEVQKERGAVKFPVIALSLNGTRLGVLEEFFGEEPVYLPVTSGAGGTQAAMNAILVAAGTRLPADVLATPQPKAEPLEELVLELTDFKFQEHDGFRRASARARLVYEPATVGRPEVVSEQTWRLVAPIGPIEAEDLLWYLVKYAEWPAHFQNRAQKVEKTLMRWGQLLHDAAMPAAYTANVARAWAKIGYAGRRFSVYVDPALEAGAPAADVENAREAATHLLGLPWELLHDGEGYLFQGPKPTRVRRRLPNTRGLDVPVVAPPIRILLITARPEDEACGYVDHRASALPLVEAMESLPGLVELHVLNPPTLPALREELDQARRANRPYHVLHFDCYGVYNRAVGLGGLGFELPEDVGKLEGRRHVTVFTGELGSVVLDYRIPLVFLQSGGYHTAQAEQASDSVATELLKVGVASVVAMSHSVLVETASRFVAAFYQALAEGKRVGDAMLAGQRRLKDDTFRGHILGAGELRLEDWFVPVLFQEKDDPQLFTTTPVRQTLEHFQAALARRLGHLPPVPTTGFIGRSRELLALQRLLRPEGGARYAVVRGQGGEGKTTLAAEFARWMVRSHQMRRAAFVSMEGLGMNIAESVLDKLGDQLVKPGFSTQADCNGDLGRAEQEIARVLREQSALLVMDNMESILPPPFMEQETPDALSHELHEELNAVLALCERLMKAGDTRLVFTTREALPAPFAGVRQRWELRRLSGEDAVKLVERLLSFAGAYPQDVSNVGREKIEELVDMVHGHARTLVLLIPSLRNRGVQATRETLAELMEGMEQRFPGSREQSVFASVELSLRRLSEAGRDRVRVLGVFHGGVDLDVLCMMMKWKREDVDALAVELVATGLATPSSHDHLTLNPALCPYLRVALNSAERETLTARWIEVMREYLQFLLGQRSQNSEMAARLTILNVQNLFELLNLVMQARDAEATVDVATSLYTLLQTLGKPRLLERVGHVRDHFMATLQADWNHASFQAARTRIEQQLSAGQLRLAREGAEELLRRARAAGESAYSNAHLDMTTACWLLAHMLVITEQVECAVALAHEAAERCTGTDGRAYQRLRGNAYCALGDAFLKLGQYEKATAYFEQAHAVDCDLDYLRGQAHDLLKLSTSARCQRRWDAALSLCLRAMDGFRQWGEFTMVSKALLEAGRIYRELGQVGEAEDALRESLSISVRLEDVAGQANALHQFGSLYHDPLDRLEEAAAFYQQSITKYVEIGSDAQEGVGRTELAVILRKLRRYDEARQEINRAIDCKAQFGRVTEPWKSWDALGEIESHAGNPDAAAEAKREAVASYLAYRRDGGENHFVHGRISRTVTQSLLGDDPAAASAHLQQLVADPDLAWLLPFIHGLQAVVAGSRDRALADAPGLDYTMAAEILLLMETLEDASG